MSSVMIHQPEYLPWTNLFVKMAFCDVFVFLDTVQYTRRSFQNRNKIKNSRAEQWLTVPLKKAPRSQVIMDMKIDNSKRWKTSHLSALRSAYKSTAYGKEIFPLLTSVYEREWENLSDLNCSITVKIAESLGLNTRFMRASELSAQGTGSERILNICSELGAGEYISGTGAKDYLNEENFKRDHVDVVYVPPVCIEYEQVFPAGGFVRDLSIIDYLFNSGINVVQQKIRSCREEMERKIEDIKVYA